MAHAQMKALMAVVSTQADQRLAEVEADLMQTRLLLAEAVEKLGSAFMEIHQAVDMQQQTLISLLDDGASVAACAARLEPFRNEIGRQVGAAVTGLQFQDLTSQLAGRMARHLADLRDLFGALDTPDAALPGSESEALLAMLNLMNERVGAHCNERAGSVRCTVGQQHMESGDIELF
jgi:hypothetical protein